MTAQTLPPADGPWPLDLDLHLLREGTHERLYEILGAHPAEARGMRGIRFAVWAPNTSAVSVVGDFNGWDPARHPLSCLGDSGVWAGLVPGIGPGTVYKYAVSTRDGRTLWKSDPFAFAAELPPGTSSVVAARNHRLAHPPLRGRPGSPPPHRAPISVYEVHLGSWRRSPQDPARAPGYRWIAPELADYAREMGFTHVELMPVMEHPFGGSWGYQVSSYYAPTARYGTPDDFRFLVDALHERGVGVILDWVPGHFPQDPAHLARFDGTALYEHLDPREGVHPDWDTFLFNLGRREVRNFLTANAFYWLSEFQVDGLRIDAVASMLYRDYSRGDGEWIPNREGGRESLEAVSFLKDLNERVHARFPGVLMIAEESTAWPGVSRPVGQGGLGFGFKWNMGWMHDTLAYFREDPVHRRHHHEKLTFGLLYAWSENFILSLSHDEVVHGKGSLLSKMHGDRWQAFASLRSLYGYLWAHPGKKHLFMGGEFAQAREWDHDRSLDWHLLSDPAHAGVQRLVADLNRIYRAESALWEADGESAGFAWIDVESRDDNVIAFERIAPSSGRRLVCACNLSPVPRIRRRLGLPFGGRWREVLNTDAACYGGGNVGNGGEVRAEERTWHGRPFSAEVTLPPLSALWLAQGGREPPGRSRGASRP